LPEYPGIAYQHDASNRGLASAYNYALHCAAEEGCAWLLLLDQDTEVTAAYLKEAASLSASLCVDHRVAAIVPKLEGPLGIKSPTLDFLCWLRRQVQFRNRRPLFATAAMHGLQPAHLSAFNSAAILRVGALLTIGGFPADFWLDFLDVAVFHALDAHAGRIFVMHACLHHGFSMDTEAFYSGPTSLDRHRNMLIAMVHYVRTRGTRSDLLLSRLYLLRNALNLLRRSKDLRFGLLSLRQAFLMQGEPDETSGKAPPHS
jgi:GT2 family glycosyltransferase